MEHSPAKKDLGVLVGGELDVSQQHAIAAPKKQSYPGMHQKQCGQQGEGGDLVPFLCTGESAVSSCGVFCTGETYICVVCPEEGHRNGPGDGTPLLRGQAERAGAV